MLFAKLLRVIAFFCGVGGEVMLKIDLHETTDRQTTANNLFITYINATDLQRLQNGNATMNLDMKNNMLGHQLFKRNPDSPMYVPLDLGHQIGIPRERSSHTQLVQIKGDSSKIKKSLDDFTMRKRRTYLSTRKFDFPFIDLNSKYHQVSDEDYLRRRNMVEDNFADRDQRIFEVLTKQNKLIERIANSLLLREEKKKKIARTYFDDILESVEKRQSSVNAKTIKPKTTTKKQKAVVTVIDETEIRKALKADPFVSRILRLAGKKKQEYEGQKDRADGYLM
ncbi:uncharacterized protein LOC116778264 isoform X2 [Danaus plexippus]|uniref:uncharacterized protein LOC116778264 isoform X2 n=1 Tax=Danaus plexippus TaxID=13037 RepID=UPI002AB1B48C|nr:uncharacterized protein LOC116778264 isoform X2 [Danaus plexippus]